MPPAGTNTVWTEEEIAAYAGSLAGDPRRAGELAALLREDHPFYEQRGGAAVVRLRGWVLLSLARTGITDETLLFVLEELDNGLDPYLVAAAALALRSYPTPKAAFAPFVISSLGNIMGRNQPVSFAHYGDYVVSPRAGASPIRELLETLRWLGPAARSVLPEVQAFARNPAFPRELKGPLDGAIRAIALEQPRNGNEQACCELPEALRGLATWTKQAFRSDQAVIFEGDQGGRLTFDEVFSGHPTIVVFFYTRCDNPLKCTLSITKLGRVQQLLAARGLAGRIHTAAITYDPDFDLTARMRSYGERRGLALGPTNRMLRTMEGAASLRSHFKLGVNFVESVVNRHRIEAYILDDRGGIAYCFERLQWDEAEVVERAAALLESGPAEVKPVPAGATLGSLAALGLAIFPKCPACWAAYLSTLGIAGLERIPYPWVAPLLAVAALINLGSVWLRARSTHRWTGAWLVTAGAAMIGLSRFGWPLAGWGVAATLIGSVVSTLPLRDSRVQGREKRFGLG